MRSTMYTVLRNFGLCASLRVGTQLCTTLRYAQALKAWCFDGRTWLTVSHTVPRI